MIFFVLLTVLIITTSCGYLLSELFKPSENRIITFTFFLQYAPEMLLTSSEKIDYSKPIEAKLDSFIFKINDQNYEDRTGIRSNSSLDLRKFSYDGYNDYTYSGPAIQNISVDATITYLYTLEETNESSSLTIVVSGSKPFTGDLSGVTIVLNGSTDEVWIDRNDGFILVNGTVNNWDKNEHSVVKVFPYTVQQEDRKNIVFQNEQDSNVGKFRIYIKKGEQNLRIRVGNNETEINPNNPIISF